jgi:hypothetical protein
MIQTDNPQYDTWDKQLALHSALLDMVAEERSAEEYQKHLDSFAPKGSVSESTSSKSKLSGSQSVANAAVKVQPTFPAVTNSSILPTAHCLIHPNGKHCNSECNEQTNIRNQKLRQDQLITVIKQLQQRVSKKKLEERKQRGATRKQAYLERKSADQGKPDSSTKLLTNASHSDTISTTSSSAQTKKSSSTKRTSEEVEVQDSQGSVASAQKKRKTKNTDAPAEVANVVMRLRGGGDSPHNSDGDEDFNDDSDSNWKHSDSYGKTQGDLSEGEEDIRAIHVSELIYIKSIYCKHTVFVHDGSGVATFHR